MYSPTNEDKNIATKSSRASCRNKQQGQAVLEYTLILAVIFGIFIVAVKPKIGDLRQKLAEGLKGGLLASDPGKSNFYYFPMK